MCGLGHILEAQGIATIVVGLVPQHVKIMRPPRALVVPFEAGRPFGEPNAVALQHEVLSEALGLLDAAGPGPLIETLEVDVAPLEAAEAWVCPVSFPVATSGTAVADRLLDETRLLMPWFDQSEKQRGHSAMGASGMDVENICAWLCEFTDEPRPEESPVAERTLGETFKLAVEDLKAFYLEAATAQPGSGTAQSINNWFWDETAAGELLWDLRQQLRKDPDDVVRVHAARTLVPEAQVGRRKAMA